MQGLGLGDACQLNLPSPQHSINSWAVAKAKELSFTASFYKAFRARLRSAWPDVGQSRVSITSLLLKLRLESKAEGSMSSTYCKVNSARFAKTARKLEPAAVNGAEAGRDCWTD